MPKPMPNVTRKTDMTAAARQLALAGQEGFSQALVTEDKGQFMTQWMGPDQPPAQDVGQGEGPRVWDYPTGYNLRRVPRQDRILSYDQLEFLAGCSPVRYCIEERKNRVKARAWDIVPLETGIQVAQQYAKEIAAAKKYWSRPDGVHTFKEWASMVLEDSFVYGPAVIYRWPRRDGGLLGHRVLSAKYWVPLLNTIGDTPAPPDPAYWQVIKGVVWHKASTEQMIYTTRNPKAGLVYPMGEVEMLAMDINLQLRRDYMDLAHYTESNIPAGLGEVPKEWGKTQLENFQEYWNKMLAGDLAARSKIIFVPSGFNFKNFVTLDEEKHVRFSEFLSRRVCAIFHVSAQPYVAQVNRATAETADESQAESADEPTMEWFEAIITRELQEVQQFPMLQFKFTDIRVRDEAAQSEKRKTQVAIGERSLDELREEDGLEGYGLPPFVLTAQGPQYLDSPALRKKYPDFFAAQDEDQQKKDAQAAAIRGQIEGATPPEPGGPEPNGSPEPSGEPEPFTIKAHGPWASELLKWRRMALKRLREGRTVRAFESTVLPAQALALLNEGSAALAKADEVEGLFKRVLALQEDEQRHPFDLAKAAARFPDTTSIRTRGEKRLTAFFKELFARQGETVLAALKRLEE